ncbi:MAG: hypothetical protein HQL20_02335 [Candidatus Omnitrophica bacterium]|nr:hypothetical protein [Candidatus Omnitrophota bacterium]
MIPVPLKHWIFLFFVGITVWAYWPSLQHAPKHDQLGFLADMALRDGAWEKTAGAYSWNRERLFMGADQFLFRPILNLFLAGQLLVFGYNFTLWQGMSIFVHLLVGLSVYRLLNVIRPGLSAAVAAGFFLLMLSNVPMVVWNNIGAYMIFCVLILESLVRWLKHQRNSDDQGSLLGCGICLLLACFVFEAGVVYCLCFVFMSLLTKRSGYCSLLLLTPVIIYFTVDIADFLLRSTVFNSEAGRISGQALSFQTLSNCLIAIKWFFLTGIYLKVSEIIPIERVVVSPLTLNWHWPFTVVNEHLLRGIIACVIYAFALGLSFRSWSLERRSFLSLLLLMIIGLVVFICLGRVNSRGLITGLSFNSYYIYLFWVLAIPLAYSCLNLSAIRARKDGRTIGVLVCLLCGTMVFINAYSIRNANAFVARLDKPRRVLLDTTTAFVKARRDEVNFSFFVPPNYPGNYAGKWLHKAKDPLWRRYTLAEALYPRFHNKINPMYVLRSAEGNISGQ